MALALVAFGLAGLALTKAPEAADTVEREMTVSPATVTPTAASPSPSSAPSPTPTPDNLPSIELPGEPVVLIMGDSFTAGIGALPAEEGWAYRVADSLGYPTDIDGISGTGFAWGGGQQDNLGLEYEFRLQEISRNPAFVPNVLILQGGHNDALLNNPDEVTAATTRTVDTARRLWPGVQVVVLGPSAPQPAAQEMLATNGAVRAGAAAADAPYIDAAAAAWFTSANSLEFNFDGLHLNTAGHAHMAEKFLESWTTLIS